MHIVRILLLLAVGILAACTSEVGDVPASDPASEIHVTTDSAPFIQASRTINGMCGNPAEFGRCGCYMNGILTSCQAALSCLQAGFCQIEREAKAVNVKSTAKTYSDLSKALSNMCALSAEYWRCECSIDGIAANCDSAHRCLQAGFCQQVSAVN